MTRFLSALFLAILLASPLAQSDDELMDLMGKQVITDESTGEEAKVVSPVTIKKLIEKPTSEQNIFLGFFAAGEFEKALYQWPSAFDNSDFGKSANGQAISAYLLFKAGVPVYALESLLKSVSEPQKIDDIVKKLWQEIAPVDNVAWTRIDSKLWNDGWTSFFGAPIEVKVLAQGTFTFAELEKIKDLIKKSDKGSFERAWLNWQLVLAQGIEGDAAISARALSILMKEPNNPVSQDLMTIAAARLLYQNGYLEPAIKYYEKVPKSSDDWFDAQEEIAWALVRKGEPQNAIAVTQSLLNPAFSSLVGPESVYVRSIAQLKVCDYPEVRNSLDTFRKLFKERTKQMMDLAESGRSPAVEKFIGRSKENRVVSKDLGSDASKLPRYITRDAVLSRMIQAEKMLEGEAARMSELYARSLSQGTGQVGFQGRLETLKKDLEARAKSARSAAYARVKEIASDELNEIAQTLQKMHVVEAEMLQQLSMADRVIHASSKSTADVKTGTTGSRAKDRLVWPKEKETWFDELANYRVDLKKGCQSVKR